MLFYRLVCNEVSLTVADRLALPLSTSEWCQAVSLLCAVRCTPHQLVCLWVRSCVFLDDCGRRGLSMGVGKTQSLMLFVMLLFSFVAKS